MTTADGGPRDATAKWPAETPVLRLDLRGLQCPLPVLRTRKALRALSIGDGLVVECTDPLSTIDIPHFVAAGGHHLLDATRQDAVFVFHIVKRR